MTRTLRLRGRLPPPRQFVTSRPTARGIRRVLTNAALSLAKPAQSDEGRTPRLVNGGNPPRRAQ
jgi:hypothetical protein